MLKHLHILRVAGRAGEPLRTRWVLAIEFNPGHLPSRWMEANVPPDVTDAELDALVVELRVTVTEKRLELEAQTSETNPAIPPLLKEDE